MLAPSRNARNSPIISEQADNYPPRYDNLHIISHLINRKLGATRNTGINAAAGKFIIFLDHDDELVEGSLNALIETLENSGDLDILFFDYESKEGAAVTPNLSFRQSCRETTSGREFFKHNQIPWTSWQYAYNRDFINANALRQIEGHMFEDADFVLKATLAAKRFRYEPITVIRYYLSPNQTTKIRKGQDSKIEDMFFLNARVREIALSEDSNDPEAARLVWGQYYFRQKNLIVKYLWRARFSTIRRILKTYPTDTSSPGALLGLTARHPAMTAYGILLAKPLLPLARKAFMLLSRKGS